MFTIYSVLPRILVSTESSDDPRDFFFFGMVKSPIVLVFDVNNIIFPPICFIVMYAAFNTEP